ncbi:Na+/H+ antiporter subunit E [Micrococcus sp.]|uniref:Na+/H+ antiporter subunit E n=1 Tax=Micrococcus sp. TaxID=1271 RepID=UPI002A909969|nr:Na+/H+ antiporter subunit E [Micrococcus sp.]MDY6054431.1 Na+/H+ antiporter subunit E [Micrococcus sp.]
MSAPHPAPSAAPLEGTVDLAPGTASALSWPWRWLVFWCWYAWALVTSSEAVLQDLFTPGDQSRPGIARVRSNCRTDAEVTLLSALITLTPGTLTLGTRREGAVGEEDGDRQARRLLYVHGLYAEDAAALRTEIHDMEARMLHAMRRTGVAR